MRVSNLLGRFTHEVTFLDEWEFVILHGPNGVGKTKLLELLTAVSAGRLHNLFTLPFDALDLGFADGSFLRIVRNGQLRLHPDGQAEPPSSLEVRLEQPHEDVLQFSVARDDLHPEESRLRYLDRDLPLERMDQDTWFDFSHEDYVDLNAIDRRYPGYLGPPWPRVTHIDDEFSSFTRRFRVHLIETQRLLSLTAPQRSRQRGPVQQNTAERYAQDLTRRIREALAENSQTSQQLDRTFPRRVLETRPPDHVTDKDIRARYEAQSSLRDRLGEIAVLDAYASVPLPQRHLDDWERRVLWTYLDDTDQKLATFRHLLDRVGLMRRIVNSRFLFNELRIDRERGFRFTTTSGEEVGPSALSSGEQHELVLMYALLFNVDPETTVLIDEPEISLHIAWQQQFLDDIVEIAQLASLRFVIATHSPQIIHKWWSRAVALFSENDVDKRNRQLSGVHH
jgi:predicted ATP-binding protein involved in virulence